MNIKFAILCLFLCQSVFALPVDVEEFRQGMAKDRPDVYARVMRAFGHSDVSMDSSTRARYQKLLAKEGSLTVEFVFEETTFASSLSVTKSIHDESSLCLLRATGKRGSNSIALKFELQEQTPFAKLTQDSTGWQLLIDDGGRNKLNAHISKTGGLVVNSGQGLDVFEINTSALLTFGGDVIFSKVNLGTEQASNIGRMEVKEFSLKPFDGVRSTFTNEGDLYLEDLYIKKSTFFNKHKLSNRKQLNVDLDHGDFINDKVDTKSGRIKVGVLKLAGIKGTFSNKGMLETSVLQGVIHELSNDGTISVNDEKGNVYLVGDVFENRSTWQTVSDIKLQFQDIENSGSVAASFLALQPAGSIKNNVGAELHAKQIAIDGKGYLANEGIIFSEDQLKLKVSSTINEGLLSAKNLLQIDNDGNYFKNTAEGKIQTEGVVQIAATGPWWINAGQIIADEVQSHGILFNIKSGNIRGQRAILNGQLFNDATLTANELKAHMQGIGGEGKLLMANGQLKIDGDHVQMGQWSCYDKCDWTAPSFSIFGTIEGKADGGQPGQLTITSENGELWHGGNLYCAAGASCSTVSNGKTINMPSSKIISDGELKQQSILGDLRLDGVINGKGSYAASTLAGNINNYGVIDLGGPVEFEAANNLGNAHGAKISGEDIAFNAKNVEQAGKVDARGKFSGEAQEIFINRDEIRSGKGFYAKAGQKFENVPRATIANGNGVLKIESPEVINKGKILSKEDLEIFASKLFLNEGGIVNVGRDATISGDTVRNVAGRILVAHLLTIHAKKLENNRAPTIVKPGEDCPHPPLWEPRGFWFFGSLGKRTCQGDYEVETSNAAVISSMGDIVLDVDDSTNSASTIYAKGNITITGKQFRNLAHNLKNYKITKSWRHWETCTLGIFCNDHYEPTTDVRNEPDYVGAMLAADGKITINNKDAVKQQALGFENTGNVKSGESFNLVSEDETTRFINGLFDSYTPTAKKSEPKSGNMEVYTYMDTLGNLYFFRITAVNEKDPSSDQKIQFMLIPANEADQKTLNQLVGSVTRGLSERPQIAYLQTDKTPTLSHRFVMHPQLAAQVVQSMLITELGSSHLSGFEGKTAIEQYVTLETRGYQYAQKLVGGTSNKDALSLTSEQIANAKDTFIYYDVVNHEGEVGYVPVLHIGKEEAERHVSNPDGTIEASNIHIVTGDVKNTGTLKSTGDIKITAHVFENRRRDYKTTEAVKGQKNIWGDTETRVFEVRTPQIGGDIIGVNVELVAEKNAVNEGGKIVGAQKVYLISKKGNVEHKAFVGSHVVHWHQCGWDKAMGRSSAGEALDYYPAEIISGGNVGVAAEVGEVLVKASEIIGKDNVDVSGYKKVVIEADMSKHTTADSHAPFKGDHKETIVVQRSEIISEEGDININSLGGSVSISAATLSALKGKVILEAKDRINISTQSMQYTNSKTEAAGGFNIGSTTTEVVQTAVEQTVISALKGVTMKAGEDNVLEAVLMYSGGCIHIVAGRDNRFKGFEKNTDITTQGWNIGISFPGSGAIEALMEGRRGDAIKELRDGDPLLSVINRLRQAKDAANRIGEGTYVAIEALRVLDQYIKMSSQPGATNLGMLSQRMGLTDSKGKFAPQITLHVGTFESETQMTEVLRTALSAQGEVKIESGRDTHLLDGTVVDTNDRILIVAAGDVITSSAKNKIHTDTESSSFNIGYGAGGVTGGASYSSGSRDTVTNQNVVLRGKEIKIICDNFKGTGLEIKAEDVDLDVKKIMVLKSVQDTDHGNSNSFGFQVSGTNGGASFAHETIDKDHVNNPANINATKTLKIKVGDTLYLIGGVLNGPRDATSITADKLKTTNIHDHDDTSSFGFSAQFSRGEDSEENPIPAVFDFDHKQKEYVGVTQATISESAVLEINKISEDLKNINRKIDEVQIGSSDESHFRAVVPLLNLEKIQNDIHRLKELLGADKKPAKVYEVYLSPDISQESGITEDVTETRVQDDKSKESSQSVKNEESNKKVNTYNKKRTRGEKLKIVIEKSSAIDGHEYEDAILEVVNADGDSLGKARVVGVKNDSEKSKLQERSYTDAKGQQTRVTKYGERVYVVQGDENVLKKLDVYFDGLVIKIIGGSGQVLTGFEIAIGSSGLGSAFGVLLASHGVDEIKTGLRELRTGIPQKTATTEILEGSSIPTFFADLIDESIGLLQPAKVLLKTGHISFEAIPHVLGIIRAAIHEYKAPHDDKLLEWISPLNAESQCALNSGLVPSEISH